MASIIYLEAFDRAKRTSQTTKVRSDVQSGARVPTVTSSGKVHLLMDIYGGLACQNVARWPFRKVLWRAPSELTCPDCWNVLNSSRTDVPASRRGLSLWFSGDTPATEEAGAAGPADR